MREKLFENLPDEVWRQIEDYPDYYVSNLGRIVNKISCVILQSGSCKRYHRITLKDKTFLIHRIVAKAFPEICGKWFEGCEVHHLDFNPLNNRVDNLIVCTSKEHDVYHHEKRVEQGRLIVEKMHNEEIWKKISKKAKGRIISPETRIKMGNSRSGEKNGMFGKHHTEEAKMKMSANRKGKGGLKGENHPNYGKKFSEDYCAKLSKSHDSVKKPIYQYTLDGEFIREWESSAAAAKALGFTSSGIRKNCICKTKQAYGYIWKYKKDIDNSEKYLED